MSLPGEFRVTALEFRLRTEDPLEMPEYAGALFRGGFGKYLRELACRTGAPDCEGCPHLARCAYGIVFETPADPAQSVMLKAYPFAPHPFVLTPPLDEGSRLPAGAEFSLPLTLIGRGRGYLAHFIEGLDAMGRSGRFGGRFRVVEILEAGGEKAKIYDGFTRRLLRPLPLWSMPGQTPARSIRMEFVTPLRLREKGAYTKGPAFATLVQALVRRIHMLGCAHEGWPDELEWRRPLLEAADRVETVGAEWREFRWSRRSGRQGRVIPMDGLRGWMEVRGDLGPLLPVLELGRHLHIGSGTVMGMGRYRLEVLG